MEKEQSVNWEKLGLSERMPVKIYTIIIVAMSALGACGELQLFEYCYIPYIHLRVHYVQI